MTYDASEFKDKDLEQVARIIVGRIVALSGASIEIELGPDEWREIADMLGAFARRAYYEGLSDSDIREKEQIYMAAALVGTSGKLYHDPALAAARAYDVAKAAVALLEGAQPDTPDHD